MLGARLTSAERPPIAAAAQPASGRSSGVEHNLAKVGVEGSNPFARSSFQPIESRAFDSIVALRPLLRTALNR